MLDPITTSNNNTNHIQQTQYYLHQDTLSVRSLEQNKRECVYIPAGTVISVRDHSPENTHQGFVEVLWDAKTVFMFSEDIRERAVPLYSHR
jgi:hypothetical protein